jgi:hypothetical protein
MNPAISAISCLVNVGMPRDLAELIAEYACEQYAFSDIKMYAYIFAESHMAICRVSMHIDGASSSVGYSLEKIKGNWPAYKWIIDKYVDSNYGALMLHDLISSNLYALICGGYGTGYGYGDTYNTILERGVVFVERSYAYKGPHRLYKFTFYLDDVHEICDSGTNKFSFIVTEFARNSVVGMLKHAEK